METQEAAPHPVRKGIQAKDISDEDFIAAVQEASRQAAKRWGAKDAWAMVWDVTAILGVPEKVVRAKAERIIKRGLMDGCTCGCRGDFDLRGKPDDPFVS